MERPAIVWIALQSRVSAIESFQLMQEAGNYLPEHVKPWTYWIQAILFVAPLLFIKHMTPRILILTQILNTFAAYLVFVWEGDQVTKLFGLGHLFWIWPAVYLYFDIRKKALSRIYRAFAVLALLTISASLLLDIRDTAQWVLGERGSVLVNVPAENPLYRIRKIKQVAPTINYIHIAYSGFRSTLIGS